MLGEDRSVASGRAMERDRGRQGPRAEALHAGGQAGAGRRGLAFQPEATPSLGECRSAAEPRRAAKQRRHAGFHRAAALPSSVERPPAGDDWAHEIKLDGYRMQLRVADGEATLRTRKGLDWTRQVPAIADAARRLAGLHHRRRGRARSTTNGAPDFARAAGRAVRRKWTIWSSSRSTCCSRGEDLRQLPLHRAQGAAARSC